MSKRTSFLFFITLILSLAVVGIPGTRAKKDYRRSDSPLLHLTTDEEKWISIVPPEPLQDREVEQEVEIFIYDVKTKKVKDIIKPKKSTMSKYPENQGLLPSELVPESVFPPDDRELISPTISYPWRTICKLRMHFPSGWYMASGFIIDGYHVLTAGHCVYDPFLDEWAYSIEVIPAFDGGYAPFYHAWAAKMTVNGDWYNHGWYTDDFAILTLDRNVGTFTGWMGLEYANPSDSIYTGILNTAGYPGDLDPFGRYMFFDSDSGAGADEYNHWYYMDTYGGQSGSAVWYFDGTSRNVLSVHAYGKYPPLWPNSNMGTRLNEDKFDMIDYVFVIDDPPVDYANLIDDGQAWSGFEPTIVMPGDSSFSVWSDIRNIGTAESDDFYISYYASTDTIITDSDHLIGIVSIPSIQPFTYYESEWSGTFPSGISGGTYWVGWIIDSTDVVYEPLDYGEYNNMAYKESYQLTVESIVSISVNPNFMDFDTIIQGESSESQDITITSTSNCHVKVSASVTGETTPDFYDDNLWLKVGDIQTDLAGFSCNILENEPPKVVGIILSVPRNAPTDLQEGTLVFWAEESP